MKTFYIILSALLLTLSATVSSAFSTPADTTRLASIPVWRLDRLLNDALGRRAADSAYRAELKANLVLQLRLVTLDSSYQKRSQETVSLREVKDALMTAQQVADARAAKWEKEARKQKRLKAGAIIIGGILVILALFHGG